MKFHNVRKFQPLRVLSKQHVSVTQQSDGLLFIALRRYVQLKTGRYGQWSVTAELNVQTLQFSAVMTTVSFSIHFFES